MADRTRIDQLLTMAWNTRSTARTLGIVNQILEIAPDTIEALIIKADNTEDSSARERILLRALEAFEKPDSCNPDDKDLLFYVVNQRMAFTMFYANKFPEALKYCETALSSRAAQEDEEAQENNGELKSLWYRIMLELEQWQKVLAETMREEERTLAWAYSRLVSAYMLAPDKERVKGVCANMFWDALILAPDVPFYMLGYLPEPDETEDEEAHENFDFAVLYYDTISVSEEFLQWFTRGVILFGLLSQRFDEKEREYLLDVLDTLGGYEEYERMSSIILESDDAAIIEMLAANKCLGD